MPRRIELIVDEPIPRKEGEWQDLEDRLRGLWLKSKRKPLRGPAFVSFHWTSPKPQLLEDECGLAYEVTCAAMFAIAGRALSGGGRCEVGYPPKLILTLEEA